jgi:hypothetical protein
MTVAKTGVCTKMPSKNQEPQANDAPNDPLATLSAELDGCRKSINYCIGIALGPGIVADKEALFAGKQVNDFEMCFRFMDLALKLMEASAGLGEAVARIKGEMRQSITVDRYEHGPAGAGPTRNLSTQRLKERLANARAIKLQGEGGVPESEKQPRE